MDTPTYYEIRLQGQLQGNWRDWFGEMTLAPLANGQLLLCGPVTDQAALFGILACIRDLGLTLIAVNPLIRNSLGNESGQAA